MIDSLSINWADIANNLLDKGEVAIMSTIAAVKSSAPYIWELTQRQVVAEATINFYASCAFLMASIILFTIGMILIHKKADDFVGWCLVPGIIVGIASTISTIATGRLYFLIQANPDYYTIQRIIELGKSVF